MATRFYLPSSGAAAVSPAYDGGWDDTTYAYSRLKCVVTKISSSMTSISISGDGDSTDKDYLLRQYVSDPISSQTISAQTIKYQIRALEDSSVNNLYTSINIRVVSNDGGTVRGTVLSLTRDNTEVDSSVLTNRSFSATSSEVVAQANDRIVIEIGFGGDPNPNQDHDGTLSVGDDNSTDLPENDTETTAYNPWVEFANTIAGLDTTDDLTATDLTASAPTLDTPTIGQKHALTASELTSSTPTMDQPAIGQIHALTATELTSGTPTLDSPTIQLVTPLTATELTSSAPTLDQPTIGQTHVLTATELTSSVPTLDIPSIGQTHVLSATELTGDTPTLDTPTLAQVHSLSANDLTSSAPTLDTPDIGQVHVLNATELTSGTPTLDTPTLQTEGADVLTADDLTSGTPTLDTPTFGQIHALAASELTSGTPTFDAVTISQIHSLTATELTSGVVSIDTPTLQIPQWARPDSTISAGQWQSTEGTLYEAINEVVPDNNDYIYSDHDPTASQVEVGLSDVVDPATGDGHIIWYIAHKDGPGTASVTYYLMQGVTQIATWTDNNISATPSLSSHEISSAEADNITDYTTLSIKMEANVT